jgi:2-keto-3-deoxy-L-rhamnonate aldolase RhmA
MNDTSRSAGRKGTLRERMLAGETVLGAWLQFSDPFVAEAMAHAGWDWLLVDMEHGPVSLDAAATMVTAIRTTPVVPLVRPAWNESSQIQRVLDLGCAGIVVPVVNTAADARQVVRDARYPPLGERSRGGVRPLLAFEMDAMTYFERSNDDVLVLVQIETQLAVSNVAEIVAVEGVDGVFLGPNDLAASVGKRWPDVWNEDAAYMDAVAHVAAVTRAAGKVAGFLSRDAAMAKQVVDMGYRFVGVSSDINYLLGAAKRAAAAARAELRS